MPFRNPKICEFLKPWRDTWYLSHTIGTRSKLSKFQIQTHSGVYKNSHGTQEFVGVTYYHVLLSGAEIVSLIDLLIICKRVIKIISYAVLRSLVRKKNMFVKVCCRLRSRIPNSVFVVHTWKTGESTIRYSRYKRGVKINDFRRRVSKILILSHVHTFLLGFFYVSERKLIENTLAPEIGLEIIFSKFVATVHRKGLRQLRVLGARSQIYLMVRPCTDATIRVTFIAVCKESTLICHVFSSCHTLDLSCL